LFVLRALVGGVEARRVGVLWDFIADARVRIDELAVEEGGDSSWTRPISPRLTPVAAVHSVHVRS
jgi:hypothetical protein